MDSVSRNALPSIEEPVSPLQAQKAFSWAIATSGIRCLIVYIFLPFILPALGIATGVGPGLGALIGLIAIAANFASFRRFARSRHPLRRPAMTINVVIVGFLVVTLLLDLGNALSTST